MDRWVHWGRIETSLKNNEYVSLYESSPPSHFNYHVPRNTGRSGWRSRSNLPLHLLFVTVLLTLTQSFWLNSQTDLVFSSDKVNIVRTHWWTIAVKEAVRLKKVAFEALLDKGSPEAADRHQQTQRTAAMAVVENLAVGGIQRDHGEGHLTGLKDVLANQQPRMGNQGLAQAVFGSRRELMTRN